MIWYPHVTVATVVTRDQHYLLVEERCKNTGKLVFNQPAGHLEPGETLQQAALRETLEETAWEVELEAVIGLAIYTAPGNGVTYHRTTFAASALREHTGRALDDGINGIEWMTFEEMQANSARMRSPLVIRAVEQYRAGHHYPLALIYE